jgi:succinate dehydrogenase / fumarate reductase membrane anchor subunit
MTNDLRSPLSRAKGLGSTHHGAGHWWAQRVSAIALIPMALWFASLVVKVASGDGNLIMALTSPFNVIMLLLFLGTALYHGALGMQVVIEDYVHCSKGKPILLLLVQYGSIITIVSLVVAVLTFHVEHIALNLK